MRKIILFLSCSTLLCISYSCKEKTPLERANESLKIQAKEREIKIKKLKRETDSLLMIIRSH